ncbi:two-component system sensor protein [Rhodopirellula maiorica SM1]|uniref:Two-component system sensor protein n=2 Tax=Novipirellula TaxID=2795426 RepID=M5R9T7_9BACT|nr:two-component system sensor protein [Rhodopirellula maiorica SM1]
MSPALNHPHPVRILLVEDNDINQMLALEVLGRQGWECDTALNGVEAITRIKTGQYDLVLMDCQMPIMDGFTATREIRQMESRGEIEGESTIIAVTANALKGDRQRCLDAGMDDYLAKPFSPQQLREMVGKWLTKEKLMDAENEPHSQSDSVALDSPPICEKEFMERCMGDVTFAEMLLQSFEKDSVARLEQIASQVQTGDTVGVGETAHSLKGIAGILAAHNLQAIAFDIESAGKAGELDNVVTLLQDLRTEVNRCLAYVPTLKQQSHAAVTAS